MAVSHSNSYSITPYSENSTRPSCKKKPTQRKKVRSSKNAVIINFSEGEKVTKEDVEKALAPFGSVDFVQLCTMDACQAFVTFKNDFEKSAKKTVSSLLKTTRGILFVKSSMWTICKPEEWKKVMDHPPKVNEETISLIGKGVTVQELNEIFTNFIALNSSMSQTSLFSDSTHPFSSFSSLSLSRSCGSSSSPNAESCDSSVTITPFSFYPAQKSSGFINLPPPYHTLPDTDFFRRAKIVPPPPASLTQSIMNCYISSIQKGDSELTRRRQLSVCSKMELECNWYNML